MDFYSFAVMDSVIDCVFRLRLWIMDFFLCKNLLSYGFSVIATKNQNRIHKNHNLLLSQIFFSCFVVIRLVSFADELITSNPNDGPKVQNQHLSSYTPVIKGSRFFLGVLKLNRSKILNDSLWRTMKNV